MQALSSQHLPDYLKGCLWSYDLKKLDVDDDFRRIATNILNFGDLKAIHWLFNQYPLEMISSVLLSPLKGEWDAKSLAFWSRYLNVTPDKKIALKTFGSV